MKDLSSITGTEMMARRSATESEVACLIGQFVFQYSKFVSGLHLCVAWHNDGRDLDNYSLIAEDLGGAALLNKIDKRVREQLGSQSDGFKLYKHWLKRAHCLRETRNTIMHSRWHIEAFGRYAIAIPTPIFVEPVEEIFFTTDQLRNEGETCIKLINELNALRNKHPL